MDDATYYTALTGALLQRITELCTMVAEKEAVIAQKDALLAEIDDRTARIIASLDRHYDVSPRCDPDGDHVHEFRMFANITRAPVDVNDPIAHTAFMLMRCACGEISGFPEENFKLITPQYLARLEYIAKLPGGHHIFAGSEIMNDDHD